MTMPVQAPFYCGYNNVDSTANIVPRYRSSISRPPVQPDRNHAFDNCNPWQESFSSQRLKRGAVRD